jgi:hypothetical protein
MSREGKREIYQIKYEKMPRFCGACGFIGHIHTLSADLESTWRKI